MHFNCIITVKNLVRLIHRKYLKCDLEINIRAESPIQKGGFPDYNHLYHEIKTKIKEELHGVKNKEDDCYLIDFKHISIADNKFEPEPRKYSNYQIANKSEYNFYK